MDDPQVSDGLGVVDLFAAFNIAEGTVISALHPNTGRRNSKIPHHRRQGGSRRPRRAPGLLATHKTETVNEWLAKHPRFRMHFNPTGSSWINQVERWFGLLADQLLLRGVLKRVAALEKDVRNWIKTWNDNPKSFRWTKTAEEILDSLAKYMARFQARDTSSQNACRCRCA